MKTLKYLTTVLVGILLFSACQKEYSMESGLIGTPARGTLKNISGDCQPITVSGEYVRDSVLTDSNFVIVQVNIDTPGVYKIFTDIENGFSFSDSGYIASTGLQSFRLKASGRPILAQTTNFIVAFDTSFCTFAVTVADTSINQPPPVIITSGDYFPTSTGTNYRIENTLTTDTTHIEVVEADQILAGNTYRSFVSFSQSDLTKKDTLLYRKGGGLYYQYSSFNIISFDTATEKVEYIFLKDNVPVNSTWESPEVDATVNSVPGKAKIQFTIVGKDIQTNIGSTTIDSVIEVKDDYMFAPTATGTYQSLGSYDYYYAKNIGFIKVETLFPFPVNAFVTRYTIYY